MPPSNAPQDRHGAGVGEAGQIKFQSGENILSKFFRYSARHSRWDVLEHDPRRPVRRGTPVALGWIETSKRQARTRTCGSRLPQKIMRRGSRHLETMIITVIDYIVQRLVCADADHAMKGISKPREARSFGIVQ